MNRKRITSLVISFLGLASLVFLGFLVMNKAVSPSTTRAQTLNATPTPPPGAVIEDPVAQLRALLSPVGVSVVGTKLINVYNVRSYQTLVIEWKSYKNSPDLVDYDSNKYEHIKELKVLSITTHDGTLQSQRIASNFSDEILIVGLNSASELLWWDRMTDPRLLRSELPDAEGHLHGQRFHRSKVQIYVNAPDDEEITELRFYLPHWTGTEYALEPLYTVPFKGKKKTR